MMAPSTVGEYGQPDGALRGVRSRGPLRTLTEQQLASYRADGFLLLPDHFSREEMAELSARADEVSASVAEERGAAMGGGVCGRRAGAGGVASCAIVFKVFEPKNPTPEAAVSWPSGHQKSGRGAAARGGTPERAPRAGDPRRAAP